MLPKIQAMFRLTREPELRYAQSGTALCKVGLAASENYGEKETQLFIDATAFGKTAEMLNNVQKGHRVVVNGKISTEQWVSQEGKKQSNTVMIIESFEFVEKREGGQQQNYQAPQQQQQQDHRAYQPQQGHGNQQAKSENPSARQNSIPEIDVDNDPCPF